MKTPLQAMIWELWQTSRFELMARILGQMTLVVLFYAIALGQITSPESVHAIRGIVLMMLMIVSLCSTTWLSNLDSRQVGFCFRLGFTRPVSTAKLVLVPMLFTMASGVLCFVVPALLFRLLFRSEIPIFGPAAVIVCCISLMVMATWSPTTFFGKFVGIGTGVVGMFWGTAGLLAMSGDPDPILLVMGKPDGWDFAWPEYGGLLAVALLASVVTVFAVARQRHGGSFRWNPRFRTSNRSPRLRRKAGENRAPFSGPFAAQFWFEFRQVGPRMLLAGILVPLLVLFVIALAMNENPNWRSAPVAWLLALALSPPFFQFLGIDAVLGLRHKQGAAEYSLFDATRPLKTDQIVMIKLFVIAACSLVAWLGMAVAAGVHAFLSNDENAWRSLAMNLTEIFGTIRYSWWWFAGVSSLLLFYLSTSSMLLGFGLWLPLYGRQFFGLGMFAQAHLILSIWDAVDDDWSLRPLWIAYGWIFSALIAFGSAAVLRKALGSGYLERRVFGLACGLWIVYAVSTVTLYRKFADQIPLPAAAVAFGAALLLVPLATTAIAPLALASHRHR